jgi:hypothetical protein
MRLLKRRKLSFEGGGLVVFDQVADATKAERLLKRDGYVVRLVAPPRELRRGCDLAVEINLVEAPGIQRALMAGDAAFVEVVPLKVSTSTLLQVVKVTDYGAWTMVKAGNMKLSFDKASGVIVNTSGGGCPDIPFMHTALVGRRLDEAPRPKDEGFTLCALMLDRALDEALALWRGGE